MAVQYCYSNTNCNAEKINRKICEFLSVDFSRCVRRGDHIKESSNRSLNKLDVMEFKNAVKKNYFHLYFYFF